MTLWQKPIQAFRQEGVSKTTVQILPQWKKIDDDDNDNGNLNYHKTHTLCLTFELWKKSNQFCLSFSLCSSISLEEMYKAIYKHALCRNSIVMTVACQ